MEFHFFCLPNRCALAPFAPAELVPGGWSAFAQGPRPTTPPCSPTTAVGRSGAATGPNLREPVGRETAENERKMKKYIFCKKTWTQNKKKNLKKIIVLKIAI